MEGTSKECHMPPDGFSAGQTANGLVDHCLKNRCGQIFFCCPLVDQRLDIRFREHAAAGRDGVERLVALGIFIQSWGVCLEQRCHLIDERSGTACADAIHALFHRAAFKINYFCVFTAKLNGDIGLRGKMLQRGGYSDNLLHKRHFHMIRQG